MGGKRIRGLRVGWECCISKGGLSSTVKVYKLMESEKEVTVLAHVESSEEAGRVATGMRGT